MPRYKDEEYRIPNMQTFIEKGTDRQSGQGSSFMQDQLSHIPHYDPGNGLN